MLNGWDSQDNQHLSHTVEFHTFRIEDPDSYLRGCYLLQPVTFAIMVPNSNAYFTDLSPIRSSS